jgi:hypothetical protein
MLTIEPTVGRKVWYWPHDVDDANMNNVDHEQPLDATILFVHHTRLVNLQIIDHMGHTHTLLNTHLRQPGDDKPHDEGYAEWMSYQVDQARKYTAQEETKIPHKD